MELIREKVEEGDEAHVALADLEMCYYNIWRGGLHFILHSLGASGAMLLNIKLWIESTVASPVWNGVECPKGMPGEGLKQGCVMSPVLCVAFMVTLTCSVPNTHCMQPLPRALEEENLLPGFPAH